MIDLKISTDQERRREQIRRYWRLDANGSDFAESMDTLKEDFGLSQGAILGIVRSNSRAVSKIHKCDCGHRKEFDSRKDFRSTPKQKPFVCPKCHENGASSDAKTFGGSASRPGSSEEQKSDEQKNASKEIPTDDLADDLDQELPVTDPEVTGSPEELQKFLRQLARVLSKASQRAERLSHKVNGQDNPPASRS